MADVTDWLETLGLGKYATVFVEHEIDFEVLPELTDEDLEKLALPLGPRKKLLKAIAALASDESSAAAAKLQSLPQAERRQLTVMFIDLVGSTALSEQLDPEDLSEIIRRYQDSCAGVISRFGGYIAKFMGDGILVYFGYPQAHEDDAERAVRTGLDMVKGVSQLKTVTGQPLQVRIGIATGVVVVGELIGTDDSQERTVVGETPNLAARLQALAAPGQIVIAQASHRLLGDQFELSDLGAHNIKGLSEPVNAYTVHGVRSVESRFDAHRTKELGAIVGREQELGFIKERWQQAKDGDGQLVLISGEAGIGKSRIIRALYDLLTGKAYFGINYQCSPYHSDSALYPVTQQLMRAAGISVADAADTQLDKLEALLGRAGVEVQECAPLIAALLGLDAETRYGALALSPQQQRTQILQALVAQVTGLAQHQPVILVLEDAHWIDPSTRELIELMLDASSQSRVLLLLTARPTFEHGFGSHPRVTQIALNRLGRESVIAIIDRLSGGKTLPDELIDEIISKTDGVPLFVEELTKVILTVDYLHDAGDHYELSGSLASIAIPTTLQDSLMARLDQLPMGREVAQTAACIGREFTYSLLSDIARTDHQILQHALAQLIGAELIIQHGTAPAVSYTFKHALVRDTAYESLLKRTRRQIHERIGRVLEQRLGIQPELLAHHFAAAGFAERALDYWQQAGREALGRSANIEAVNHLQRGLELVKALPTTPERAGQELQVQLALGIALIWTHGYTATETLQAFMRAQTLSQQIGDAEGMFTALYGQWINYHCRPDFTKATVIAEQLLQLAQAQDDNASTLIAHRVFGQSLASAGAIKTGVEHLQTAQQLYRPEQHRSLVYRFGPDSEVVASAYSAWVLWVLGYPEQSQQQSQQALTTAQGMDHPSTLAFALFYALMCELLAGNLQQVEALNTKAMSVYKDNAMPIYITLAELFNGWILAKNHRQPIGITIIRRSIAEFEAKQNQINTPLYLALQADVCADLKQVDQGLACLDDALTLVNTSGERVWEAELYRLKGELLLKQDKDTSAVEAEENFHKSLALAHGQSAKSWELRTATSLAKLWRNRRDPQDAYDLLAPIYHWFTEGLNTPDLKDAKTLLDELA